ncbi:Cytochrome c [Symmachiella dynata]|uniref:PVC-type heme-binding CxxCH protein n=1 Tax=Symmachiella dynata TaxID=2527995 RepID=UPI00118B39C6|nr:PVC-type heme-binding CxxCH protein [Symmachiella dynata]QDT51234.1 Cytochrome c [Symmachiella dynata]
MLEMNRGVGCLTLLLGLVIYAPAASGQGYSPADAAGKMTVSDGLEIQVFASEPEIRQPIFVKCDDRGRLWTIQYLQYPNPAGLKRVKVDRWSRTVYDRVPKPPPHGPRGADKITILEDTDGDGRADKTRDFVDGLNLCTGVAFGQGGVFVLQVPYLLFYPDKNRDDVPDADPEVLLTGFGMEDAQSLANHLTFGPDGWLYGLNGSTTTCNIRGIEFQQGVWRYHPVTKEFELFAEGGGNLYGLTFDADGNLFYSSNGGLFWHAVQGGYYQKSFGKHGPLHNLYTYGYFAHTKNSGVTGTPTTGGTIYLGDTFPDRFRGAFLCGNFLGHSASWWKVTPRQTTVAAEHGGLLFDSHDTWFGPTDLTLGPDGAMYFADFHDQRTAHPDPDANWDRSNGRIYKLQATDAKPTPPINLAELSSNELVDLLSHPNGWYGQRARVLLAERRDASTWPRLREIALTQENGRYALQGLWALHVSGGLDDEFAAQMLAHPYEYVRAWTVRLLGDSKSVSEPMAKLLIALAETEPSPIVRSQLACTAKRLPTATALPIVQAILNRNLDNDDLRIPLLLWWAVESRAVADADQVLEQFAHADAWTVAANQPILRNLIRRYAAEGTPAGYDACLRILQNTPSQHLADAHKALGQGLSERAGGLGGIGHGGLYAQFAAGGNDAAERARRTFAETSPELKQYILGIWQKNQKDRNALTLALRAGVEEAHQYLLETTTQAAADDPELLSLLSLLQEFGREDCEAVVLQRLSDEQTDEVRGAAVKVLNRFGSAEFIDALFAQYATLPAPLQTQVRDVLLARHESARRLLALVEDGTISPESLPVDQLRRIALYEDEELDAIVRKHWGNIQPGTAEEKLAQMRRFNNDLRAAPGNPASGAELFKKHCATCHTLFNEGGKIGPDLTKANRNDLAALLANIVDPSAVIRKEYLSYVLETTSGQVMTGILAEQDAGSITLVDAKDNRTKVPRNQIEALHESATSLMPENLLQQLSPQQRRDLFAYLQGNAKP